MHNFDLMTIGDAVLDTFLSIHDQTEQCQWDDKGHLELHAGAKILVDEAAFMLGGNACNIAVGTKRLGLHVALMAELGGDEFAEKIKNGLQKEGVSLNFLKITPSSPSTFSVGIQVGDDRTLFVHHVEREHHFSFDGLTTKWLYLTSLGKNWKHVYQEVISYKKTHDVMLAFNPGSAQIAEGPASFADVLTVTDILFVNRDEAEIILHGKTIAKEQKETEENMLFRMQRVGPKMIVMTDGANGSYVMDNQAKLFYEKSAKTKIVGKTGAGDAYAAGFLGALFAGKSTQEEMQWGAVNAASVIGHIGAHTGLLSCEKLAERVKTTLLVAKAV